ncbi:MAG: ABC-F family ATP-binding cassette domain-containing protein [Pseudomonadota bacterium]
MSAFIALSNLSWSTPDGVPLFAGLNLTFGTECTGLVGRNGAGKSTLLRMIASDLLPSSGQVQRAGSVAMMRQGQIEQEAETIADLFDASTALNLLDRADQGIAEAQELAEADWALPGRMEAALARCGLSADPRTKLATLSGGQRSRAALAALVFAEPDILLLDEPTNNLDRAGRDVVMSLLRSWTGGAIIASHDRELLEEMDSIVELTALGATRYGGNYSAYRERKDAELQAAEHDLAHTEQVSKQAARRAQQASERKARTNAKGNRARASGSQSKLILDAMKARSEKSGGTAARLRDARAEAADKALVAARERIEVLQPLRMDIGPTGLAQGKTVLRLKGVSTSYDPAQPIIRKLSLTITGPERVHVSGPNGSGKTTLVRLITGQMTGQEGTVELMAQFALLDQQADLPEPEQSLLDKFLIANPNASVHLAYTALARFGFRADDALRQAGQLSGGERLRAALACALGTTPPPQLLILDEPTNHLDLDGIEALEAALAAYDGAVLAISHDKAFVRALRPDRTVSLE